MTTGEGDRVKHSRDTAGDRPLLSQRRAWQARLPWVMFVLAAAGCVVLGVAWRNATRRERVHREARELRCTFAQSSAVDELAGAIDDARTGGRRDGYVRAIGTLIDTCSDGDRAMASFRGRLYSLVYSLAQARRVAELVALREALSGTDFREWTSIELPEEPNMWQVLAGGDEEEARRIMESATRAAEAQGATHGEDARPDGGVP